MCHNRLTYRCLPCLHAWLPSLVVLQMGRRILAASSTLRFWVRPMSMHFAGEFLWTLGCTGSGVRGQNHPESRKLSSCLDQRASKDGLTIKNPEGFNSEYLLHAGKLVIDLDMKTLLKSMGKTLELEEAGDLQYNVYCNILYIYYTVYASYAHTHTHTYWYSSCVCL